MLKEYLRNMYHDLRSNSFSLCLFYPFSCLVGFFFPKLCYMLSQCHLNFKTKGLKLYKNYFRGLSYCLSIETLRFYVPL